MAKGLPALVASLLLGLAACGGQAHPPTVPLHLYGGPADASVTVDDDPVGSFELVSSHGVALPPGQHRVTVEAPGYFPFDKVIEADGDAVRLDVKLEKIPQ